MGLYIVLFLKYMELVVINITNKSWLLAPLDKSEDLAIPGPHSYVAIGWI